jgi:hypothetical protein
MLAPWIAPQHFKRTAFLELPNTTTKFIGPKKPSAPPERPFSPVISSPHALIASISGAMPIMLIIRRRL